MQVRALWTVVPPSLDSFLFAEYLQPLCVTPGFRETRFERHCSRKSPHCPYSLSDHLLGNENLNVEIVIVINELLRRENVVDLRLAEQHVTAPNIAVL
jgi:hypothetical protein